jgi:hypothetical protein
VPNSLKKREEREETVSTGERGECGTGYGRVLREQDRRVERESGARGGGCAGVGGWSFKETGRKENKLDTGEDRTKTGMRRSQSRKDC